MPNWENSKERYEKEQPRKMLAPDGGGIRGVLTLEILLQLETQKKTALDKGIQCRP